ncbi:rhodopsin [Penaeus vannamei]|uniref:Rhodopsin n=1 Tax=Penaeus vannamei TaxID=6689 RepID=A0A423SQZ4_PENVA|nr:rhodopsin [Penaeus vannamei]
MSSWNNPNPVTQLESTNPYGNYTVVDTAPKEILHMVHEHWYQFPPMNPLWYGLVGFWMVIMGCLSIAGNFVVIWVFMNTKSLRSPANLLVVNLAFSDFLMMLTMFPPMVVSCYWQTWTLGALFFWVYIFPLFYIIYSYTFIVKAVAAHEKGMREQAKKMGVKSLRSEEAQKTSAECRLCKVALMTVTLWFMAWTPYFVINWGGMFNKPMVTPLFSSGVPSSPRPTPSTTPSCTPSATPSTELPLRRSCLALPATLMAETVVVSDAGSTTTAESAEKSESA